MQRPIVSPALPPTTRFPATVCWGNGEIGIICPICSSDSCPHCVAESAWRHLILTPDTAYCPRSLQPASACTIPGCLEHDESRTVTGIHLAHVLRRRHVQAAIAATTAKTATQTRDSCPACHSIRHLSPSECGIDHPTCTTCQGKHFTSTCWSTRPDLRDDFIRRHPLHQLSRGGRKSASAPVSPFANVPGEPSTFYRVTRDALHLIERVQPGDAIPDVTLQTLGQQESSFQLWIASILTELAFLRHATSPSPPRPSPATSNGSHGHALHGLRLAHLLSGANGAPPTDVPYINQLATYVDIAHRISLASAVQLSKLDARGRAPPPNLTI